VTTGAIKGTEVGFSNVDNADYLTVVRETLREKNSWQTSKICSRRGLLPLIDTVKSQCCLPPLPVSPERVWSV